MVLAFFRKKDIIRLPSFLQHFLQRSERKTKRCQETLYVVRYRVVLYITVNYPGSVCFYESGNDVTYMPKIYAWC